jgi:endoribonuclease Dicer
MQYVCLEACKKLHEMGAITDFLLPDTGSLDDDEKPDIAEEGEPVPGTARHREFYPEGIADVLKVNNSIISTKHDTFFCSMLYASCIII